MNNVLDPRLPPQNIEAEQSVLGACLVDPSIAPRLARTLSTLDFYRDSHRIIWEVYQRLITAKTGVDIITTTDELSRIDKLEEVGGIDYLTQLINVLPTTAGADWYAGIVREMSLRRQVKLFAQELGQVAHAEDFSDKLSAAKTRLMNLSLGDSNDMTPIRDGVRRISEQIETCDPEKGIASDDYIPTGYIDLDRRIGGFYRGNLIILAARPGMGKTCLAEAMGLNIAQHRPVALFSFEEEEQHLLTRGIGFEGNVSSDCINRGPLTDILKGVNTGCNRLFEKRLWYYTRPCGVAEIHSKARKILAQEGDLGAVIIDRLELIRETQAHGENRTQFLGRISANLVYLAKDLRVPVLLIVQLSRDVEKRSNKRPMLSDLRDCGALEQDARMVLFVYREDYYDKKADGTAEIIVAKSSNGPKGTINVAWQEKIPAFRTLEIRQDPRNTERGCVND